MALGFYEKVVVVKSDTHPELIGRTGYVLGISEENGIVHSYAVSFLGAVVGHSFGPDELQGSGEFADRSLFYDDSEPPIRVRVINGKGELAD